MIASRRLPAPLYAATVLACHFMREKRAVAAVEFALIFPVALILYMGTIETYRLLSAQRKLTLAARTMADLFTQENALSHKKKILIMAAGQAVSGFAPSAYKAYFISVTITPDGSSNPNIASDAHKATVCWSKRNSALIAGRYARGDTVGLDVIPGNLRLPRTSLILVEIEMPFKTITNFLPLGDMTLKAKIMMRPRTRVFLPFVGNGDVNDGMPNPVLGPCLAKS
jgi:Flp pilus assembly protein TadG